MNIPGQDRMHSSMLWNLDRDSIRGYLLRNTIFCLDFEQISKYNSYLGATAWMKLADSLIRYFGCIQNVFLFCLTLCFTISQIQHIYDTLLFNRLFLSSWILFELRHASGSSLKLYMYIKCFFGQFFHVRWNACQTTALACVQIS